MTYIEGEHGKPRFATGTAADGWPFNLSHSGHLVAAALFAPTKQPAPTSVDVGIDIQHITRYRPELVRRVFSATDRQRLAAATDEAAREHLFAELWCRAEAYAKATGQGLQWPFPTPPAEAMFYDFTIGEDYCGTLCVRPTPDLVRPRQRSSASVAQGRLTFSQSAVSFATRQGGGSEE